MLKAVDENGLAVLGRDATKALAYFCPACRSGLILKRGRLVVPHFAHRADSKDCILCDGESVRHLELKVLCLRLFADFDPDVEHVFAGGARKADLLIPGRFVIECQTSPISVGEWERRTEDYNGLGLPVMWLWAIRRLCGFDTIALAKQHARQEV